MEKSTKKKIIIISVIDLLFAVLFGLLSIFPSIYYVISQEVLIGFEYIIILICCGIINSFLIKDATLWEHIKFFIPFSIGIVILFKIVYLYNYVSYNLTDHNDLMPGVIIIVKFAAIFFIGALLGMALKKIMNKMDKPARKKLITRLIIYPIVILITFILIRLLWLMYSGEHPEQALKIHILTLKLQGIEYCETPKEAIQRYADALIKGNRREALKYVRVTRDIFGIDSQEYKYWLYSLNKDEVKARGNEIKKGFFKEKTEWSYSYNYNYGYKDSTLPNRTYNDKINLIHTPDGWKIENY